MSFFNISFQISPIHLVEETLPTTDNTSLRSVSRTLAIFKMEFFVTLVSGSNH